MFLLINYVVVMLIILRGLNGLVGNTSQVSDRSAVNIGTTKCMDTEIGRNIGKNVILSVVFVQ